MFYQYVAKRSRDYTLCADLSVQQMNHTVGKGWHLLFAIQTPKVLLLCCIANHINISCQNPYYFSAILLCTVIKKMMASDSFIGVGGNIVSIISFVFEKYAKIQISCNNCIYLCYQSNKTD